MWKRGLSPLSMSHRNINLLIFLQNHCPMINTCAYAIRSWGGRPLHLLNTRECEVIVGTTSQLPFLSSQYCLEQYCTPYNIYIRFHLSFVYFYLTRCLHPYLLLLLLSIQLGILFTYDHPNPPEYKTKGHSPRHLDFEVLNEIEPNFFLFEFPQQSSIS